MLQIILVNLVLAIAIYFVGHLLTYLLLDDTNNLYLKAIEKFFFGLLGVIACYAIAVTSFKTVFIVVIPLLFYMRKKRKGARRKLSVSLDDMKVVLTALASLFIFLAIQFFRNDYFNPRSLVYSLDDYGYYTDTAAKMVQHAFEGRDFDLTGTGFRLPYHYFDLWINGFIISVFKLAKIQTYLFVFIPLAMMLVHLSIMAVSGEYMKSRYAVFISSFLLVFATGVLPFKAGNVLPNAMLQPRTFFTYILPGLFICYYNDRRYLVGGAVLCLMPVFNILAAPPVFTTCFLIGIHYVLKQQKKNGISMMLMSVLTCVLIVCFYLVLGSFEDVANRGMSMAAYIKGAAGVLFRDNMARLWFFYLPVLVTLLLSFRAIRPFIKERFELLFAIALLFFMSILFSALLYFNVDGSSVSLYPAPAAVCFLVTLWLCYLWNTKLTSGLIKKLSLGVIVLFLCYNFAFSVNRENSYAYYRISKPFYEDMVKVLNAGDKIAYLYSETTMKANQWAYNPFVCHGMQFPFLLNKELSLVSVSGPVSLDSIAAKTNLSPALIEKGMFYKYAQGKQMPIDELRIKFLRDNHVKYLILDRNAENALFYEAKSVRNFIDDASGYRFLELN